MSATKEPFRRLSPQEVNKALSEVYFQFAGGLKVLNHSSAQNMARAAYWYHLNYPSLGTLFYWLANRKIYKHTWRDLQVMERCNRLDIQTGRKLIYSE